MNVQAEATLLIVTVAELRANFAAIMKLVVEGNVVHITRRGSIVASLKPIEPGDDVAEEDSDVAESV